MRLPPAPQEVDTDSIHEPRIAARAAAVMPPPLPGVRRTLFDTSDWRNWALVAAGGAVVIGSVFRALGGIGHQVLGVGGLRYVSATESMRTAAGTGFVMLVVLVLLPALLLRLIGRAPKGQVSLFARTAVAAFALLAAGASFMGDMGTAMGPRVASASVPPRPAVTPAQVILNWEKAHPRDVKEPAGTAEERHAKAVERVCVEVEAIAAPITKHKGEFAKLGGVTPSTFADSKSLEARIRLLQLAQASGEEALRRTRALPQTASTLADELGMNAAESTTLIREMTGGGTVDRMVKLCELDCRLFDLLESYLSMIRSNRSKWAVDNGTLTFTDAGFERKMCAIAVEVRRVTREQDRLEGEIKDGAKVKR